MGPPAELLRQVSNWNETTTFGKVGAEPKNDNYSPTGCEGEVVSTPLVTFAALLGLNLDLAAIYTAAKG